MRDAPPHDLQPIGLKSGVKGAVEERLEKMLGLALGFALLRAQATEALHDGAEFLLEWQRRDRNLRSTDLLGTDIVLSTSTGRQNHPFPDAWKTEDGEKVSGKNRLRIFDVKL